MNHRHGWISRFPPYCLMSWLPVLLISIASLLCEFLFCWTQSLDYQWLMSVSYDFYFRRTQSHHFHKVQKHTHLLVFPDNEGPQRCHVCRWEEPTLTRTTGGPGVQHHQVVAIRGLLSLIKETRLLDYCKVHRGFNSQSPVAVVPPWTRRPRSSTSLGSKLPKGLYFLSKKLPC